MVTKPNAFVFSGSIDSWVSEAKEFESKDVSQ